MAVSEIPNKVATQYRNSPLMISVLQSLATPMDEISAEIKKVISERFFTDAKGVQLDVLGLIVGVTREVVDFTQFIYFGFDGDPTAKTFDDLGRDLSIAGRYRSSEEAGDITKLLSDNEFRALIQGKILENTSDITPNEVILITREILKVMFIDGALIPVTVRETGNASFEIVIGAELSGADASFIASLELIPRPAGVAITYTYEPAPGNLLDQSGLSLLFQDGSFIEIQ